MLIAAVVASDGILAESAEEAVQGDGTRGGSGSDSRFLLIGFIAVSSSFSSLMFSKYFCSRPTNFKSCYVLLEMKLEIQQTWLVLSQSSVPPSSLLCWPWL